MDKLTIINDALTATANNRVNLADGTHEWQVADKAFTRAVSYLIARHNWPFARKTKLLARAPANEYESQLYPDHGFRLPNDALHLVQAYHRPDGYTGKPITDYEVIGSILYCRHADSVYADYVFAPDDENWHPLASEILTRYVEAGCYRGLNEDLRAAAATEKAIEDLLLSVSPRMEQESPARNAYKSKVAEARRTRRGGGGRYA